MSRTVGARRPGCRVGRRASVPCRCVPVVDGEQLGAPKLHLQRDPAAVEAAHRLAVPPAQGWPRWSPRTGSMSSGPYPASGARLRRAVPRGRTRPRRHRRSPAGRGGPCAGAGCGSGPRPRPASRRTRPAAASPGTGPAASPPRAASRASAPASGTGLRRCSRSGAAPPAAPAPRGRSPCGRCPTPCPRPAG